MTHGGSVLSQPVLRQNCWVWGNFMNYHFISFSIPVVLLIGQILPGVNSNLTQPYGIGLLPYCVQTRGRRQMQAFVV